MQVNKNVLYLVDDDEAVCHALSVALEDYGYRVRVYHSAEAFLAEVNTASEGILLLDHRLRGMTGLELQAKLTQQGIAIPVIFFTGYIDRNGPRFLDSRLSVFCPHILRLDHAAIDHITLPS